MTLSEITCWIISRNKRHFDEVHQDLIATRSGKTLPQFITHALIIAGIGALFGFILGFFVQYSLASLISGFILQSGIPLEGGLSSPSPYANVILALRVFITLFSPLLFALLFYHVYLLYLRIEKSSKGTRITAGLHNVVAFMYAIRKGGAEMLDIFRMISLQTDVYGDVAQEFRHIVRDCDIFGDDLITAVRERALTTPSLKCKEFLQDLLAIIEGGGSLTEFLEDRVQRFHEEAIFEQKQFLRFLEMVGEIYVTTFIAGPLFLIVIMVIMGMMGASAVLELSVIAYIVLPLGSVLFLLMIDMLAMKDAHVIRMRKQGIAHEYEDIRIKEKESDQLLWEKLARYDKVTSALGWLSNPLKGCMEQPSRIFYFSIPLGFITLIPVFFHTPLVYSEAVIHAFDRRIVIAYLIAIIPFVFLYEKRRREIHAIEERIPEFLDRMAGLNAVGITLSQSITILSKTNLGALASEIKHMERGLSWGLTCSKALERFGRRIQTAFVARAVTLITVASEMSSNISDILHIAAEDAKMGITLRRERFGEMVIYIAVVYLAYFVFLMVIIVVSTQFLTVLAEQASTGSSFHILAGLGNVSLATVNRLLYHICLVQAICSGLIAGFMGEESIYSGLKHGCVMLLLALASFHVFF